MSVLFLTFGLYLASGLLGQRIHGLIYSYLPPQLSTSASGKSGGYSYQEGLTWYKDLEKAFSVAKDNNQPIFVDFTGYTCTNCRWMEVNMFIEPEIKERFKQMNLVHPFILMEVQSIKKINFMKLNVLVPPLCHIMLF